MKTVSIIGIIVSVFGIILTSTIIFKFSEYFEEIRDTFYEKNENLYWELQDIEHDHLYYIQPDSLLWVVGIFTFFLVFSIAVNRKC
jgi:hypothetical protein